MRYAIHDLGVDSEQYFQGAGVAFTSWDAVYIGHGATLQEAIDEALECAAQNGVDTTLIDPAEEGFSAADLHRELAEDAGDETHHYAAVFVSEDVIEHVDRVQYIRKDDGAILYSAHFRHGKGHLYQPAHYIDPETYDVVITHVKVVRMMDSLAVLRDIVPLMESFVTEDTDGK